ncbi:hypothetical protein NM208_g2739 [Fusarium decemcellulare]|uniref:Uncharacterized protein n=1 Tax=Fusarium decemcellulare TaxID=57161 RepID=A0ACC1SRN5_9HYPO|nr:hypothetical protein NM208_g2739 [Fusarium decemcellulare]
MLVLLPSLTFGAIVSLCESPSCLAFPVAYLIFLVQDASAASAQVSFSPRDSDDVKFRWGVPNITASSGSGDVYFQLDAPDTYAWVGLGIGSWMRNADIVVMFQNGEGNVTLSTRAGRHHIMPHYTERPNIHLIEGSGVHAGRMVANVRCSNCQNLDVNGENSWVAAWSKGNSLDSTNPASNIWFHEGKTIMNVDFAQARISSDRNPFLSSVGSTNGGANSIGNDGQFVRSPVIELDTRDAKYDAVLVAHGAIMTIVFIALYPVGAILMPLLGKWFLHSTSQILSWFLMWAGFSLGVIYANHIDFLGKQTHTRLGLIIVTLLTIQPFLGIIHHRRYTKHGGQGKIKQIHVWYGRALMILGIVNGGLGLQLARQTSGVWFIVYVVLGGLITAGYAGTVVTTSIRARQKMSRGNYARPSPQDII